jgi:hypothetical protein
MSIDRMTPTPMDPKLPEEKQSIPFDWGGLPEILRGVGVKYARPYEKEPSQ